MKGSRMRNNMGETDRDAFFLPYLRSDSMKVLLPLPVLPTIPTYLYGCKARDIYHHHLLLVRPELLSLPTYLPWSWEGHGS